ncbi:regulator of chromosome condensation 1/beta-lactamase-inhibitor protein II, partial [Haematococcus lacustris]
MPHPGLACLAQGPGGGSSAAAHWQESPRPVLVHATASVNVVKAACGTRHAALISRAGELYTWGYGAVGSLGHGSLLSQATPRRVEGRWVKSHESVVAAASSDTCTAAVTSGGSLYTWGKGLGGQLGHGTAALSCQPRLVTAFPQLGLRVMAVSCGAFHTAAITSDGALYTWGNGLAGKLGHGSHAAALLPRKVLALSSYVVSSVSCGWWHTAAV